MKIISQNWLTIYPFLDIIHLKPDFRHYSEDFLDIIYKALSYLSTLSFGGGYLSNVLKYIILNKHNFLLCMY